MSTKYKKITFTLFFIITFLILLDFKNINAKVQLNKKMQHFFRLNAGIGPSFKAFDDDRAPSGALFFSYQLGDNIFSVRFFGTIEPKIMYDINPIEYILDYSLLFGKVLKEGAYGYCSASLGIGMAKGLRRGKFLGEPGVESYEYEKLPFKYIGFTIDTQLFITTPFMGFGLYLFTNINDERTYYGYLFCLQIGKLR